AVTYSSSLHDALPILRLVHDVIARLELQRIDDVASPARPLLHLSRVVAHSTAVELGLADEGKLQLVDLETGLHGCLHHVRHARLDRKSTRLNSSHVKR